MRFVTEPIHALNHRIRGIINVLTVNRAGPDDTSSDDLKRGNAIRPNVVPERQPSGRIAGAGQSAGVGDSTLFRSDEELEAKAKIHELENNLHTANEELKQLRTNNKSLAEENSQMKIDMNRAVTELEQLLNQLGLLKSQVNELQSENKALVCEKELQDLENNPHEYLNDDDEYSEDGSPSKQTQIRNSYSEFEEETSNIGTTLADALQKYKTLPEARDEPNTQTAGDPSGDVSASKKLPLVGSAFGLFGRRNKGAGQTTDETNNSAEESSHQSGENAAASKGRGVLGGLFKRNDSGRVSPGLVGDAAASPQNSPVPQRKGLFRGIRSDRSITLSSANLGGVGDTPENSNTSEDDSSHRKSFGMFRRSNDDRKGAAPGGRDGNPTADLKQIEERDEI